MGLKKREVLTVISELDFTSMETAGLRSRMNELGKSPLYGGPFASGKTRHKPDQIAPIVQPLVIDWPIAGCVGRALDEEYWAAGWHLECVADNRIRRGRFQLVFSFDQGRTIFVLQQCKDRLGLEIVPHNLLP
jgi:hypothetical protein